MTKKLSLSFCVLSLFLLSCQTLFKPASPEKEATVGLSGGQWEAKAMIKSLETGEASVVSLDVLAQKPVPMRMEVTSSLGVALASIVMKEEQIEYILPKQKKYYYGPLSQTSLTPVLKIKVDPRTLMAALFEEALAGWNCQAEGDVLKKCQTTDGVEIRWDRENSGSRRVALSSSEFDVQVHVKKYMAKTDFSEKAFNLKVPDHYKKYRLRNGS